MHDRPESNTKSVNYEHNLDNDPLVGIQETTDQPREAARTPNREMVLEHQHRGLPRKSQNVAAALGIFFGWLGAHRFYLGYPTIGLAQLLTTFIPVILAVIIGFFMGMTASGMFYTAIGVAMIGVLWGFMEGIAIMLGALDHDGTFRPLSQ